MSDHHTLEKRGLFESLTSAWQGLCQRMRQRVEFAALERSEARRMASELGLTVGEINEMIAEGPDAARQLYQRLDQERIGKETIDPETLRDLQRCCGHCDSKALCDHELEDAPKTASWPRYCPNELTISALKAVRCH